MEQRTRLHPRLDRIDASITRWMRRHGHRLHRVTLGGFFVWMGLLKVFGGKTATSLIADVIYFGPPEATVAALGWWEAAIGACLLVRPLNRLGILLLAIRLPGTVLALILKHDVCFVAVPFEPTIEGQYLIKDTILFAAALIIGATVREERRRDVLH